MKKLLLIISVILMIVGCAHQSICTPDKYKRQAHLYELQAHKYICEQASIDGPTSGTLTPNEVSQEIGLPYIVITPAHPYYQWCDLMILQDHERDQGFSIMSFAQIKVRIEYYDKHHVEVEMDYKQTLPLIFMENHKLYDVHGNKLSKRHLDTINVYYDDVIL